MLVRFGRLTLAVVEFLAFFAALPRSAHAQDSGAGGATVEEVAPIAITADPTPVRPAPLQQRGDDTQPRTVNVHVVSDGVFAELAFVPVGSVVPRDSELEFLCQTPCNVALPIGEYHFVVQSEGRRFVRRVDVGRPTHFVVTPRTSRAPALGLLIPGALSGFAGALALILGATTASSYAYSAYYRPDLTPNWIVGGVLSFVGLPMVLVGVYLLPGTRGSIHATRRGREIASRPMRWSAAILPFGDGGALASASIAF